MRSTTYTKTNLSRQLPHIQPDHQLGRPPPSPVDSSHRNASSLPHIQPQHLLGRPPPPPPPVNSIHPNTSSPPAIYSLHALRLYRRFHLLAFTFWIGFQYTASLLIFPPWLPTNRSRRFEDEAWLALTPTGNIESSCFLDACWTSSTAARASSPWYFASQSESGVVLIDSVHDKKEWT